MEEPEGRFARGSFRRLDLDQHRAAKGLRPHACEACDRTASRPTLADASRARPSSGGNSQRYSRAYSGCQEQSENITLPWPPLHVTTAPDLIRGPGPVIPMD